MVTALGPCALCSQPWLQPCVRCRAHCLEHGIKKLLGPITALQPHTSLILWYLHPHPDTGIRQYDRGIRDQSLHRLFSGAAYSHNIWWDTRDRMQRDIMGGRRWHGRWYRTSCRLECDEDLFTLILEYLP